MKNQHVRGNGIVSDVDSTLHDNPLKIIRIIRTVASDLHSLEETYHGVGMRGIAGAVCAGILSLHVTVNMHQTATCVSLFALLHFIKPPLAIARAA